MGRTGLLFSPELRGGLALCVCLQVAIEMCSLLPQAGHTGSVMPLITDVPLADNVTVLGRGSHASGCVWDSAHPPETPLTPPTPV